MWRSSLVNRLKDSKKPLGLVAAPAGYGKTTLVAQVARTTDKLVMWIGLDQEDSEVNVLVRSIAQAFSINGQSLKQWERAASTSPSTERSAKTLASDVNLFEKDVLIVLETLEHLSEESGRWLSAFLQRLGEGHQVICTYYGGDVGVDFDAWIASGRAEIVNIEDLTFSLNETKELFSASPRPLDVLEIWKRAEGWPAALGMLLNGIPLAKAPEDLVVNVLKKLSKELQEKIVELAVLPYWSQQHVDELGLDMPNGWLKDLQATGLPLQPIDYGVVKPHAIVLNALESLLLQNSELHSTLHNQAAKVAERKGDSIQAVEGYRLGKNYSATNRVLTNLLPRYQRRSEWPIVRKLLEPFGHDVLDPYSLAMLAISYCETGSPNMGKAILQQQKSSSNPHCYTFFGLAIVAFREGDGKKCLAEVAEGLSIAPDERAIVDLLRIKAPALTMLFQLEESYEVAIDAVERAERLDDTGLLLSVLSTLQFTLTKLRRFEEAVTVAERAIDLAFNHDFQKKAMAVVDTYVNTLLSLDRGVEGLPYVEKMLKHGEMEYPLALPYMHHAKAKILEQLGHFEDGFRESQKALKLAQEFGIKTKILDCLCDEVVWYCRKNKPEKARNSLSLMSQDVVSVNEIEANKVAFYRGIVELYEGKQVSARQQFELCRTFDIAHDFFESKLFDEGYILTLDAVEKTLTEDAVDLFLSEVAERNLWYLMRENADLWREFYLEAYKKGWQREVFRSYLNVKPTPIPLLDQKRMTLSLLGGFKLLVENTELRLTPLPQEVLAFLAIHGETRSEAIVEAIWPDASLKSGKQTLAQHIRRLREELGLALETDIEPITTQDSSYALNKAIAVVVDFQKLTEELDSDDPVRRANAVLSYEPFMPNLSSQWATEIREDLTQTVVATGLQVAEHEAGRDPTLALEISRKIIAVDPFVQEAYELTAKIHKTQGDGIAAALWQKRWSVARDRLLS